MLWTLSLWLSVMRNTFPGNRFLPFSQEQFAPGVIQTRLLPLRGRLQELWFVGQVSLAICSTISMRVKKYSRLLENSRSLSLPIRSEVSECFFVNPQRIIVSSVGGGFAP